MLTVGTCNCAALEFINMQHKQTTSALCQCRHIHVLTQEELNLHVCSAIHVEVQGI